jgi:hypothetical protein
LIGILRSRKNKITPDKNILRIINNFLFNFF